MKTVVIIQARMTSSRLPHKVIAELCGVPMIVQIVRRVQLAKKVSQIVVATSEEDADTPLAEICQEYGIACFRGSLNDVLDRFYQCATLYKADVVIRLTGDNPLVDPGVIDEAITVFNEKKTLDHIYYRAGLPLGTAVEVMPYNALKIAWEEGLESSCREHVSIFIRQNTKRFNVEVGELIGHDYGSFRFTVDTAEDEWLMEKIYNELYPKNPAFSVYDAIALCEKNPEWLQINAEIKQKDHGYHPDGK